MRPCLRYLFFLLVVAGVSGCGAQKGAKLQSSVIPADKTLFQTGTEFLEKSQFIKARLAFQTLIRTYPGSDLEAEAYLSMGDSFYREGGLENMILAEDQYKNFIIFFPTNPKAADAQMKIIGINMRQMRAPDRDQHDTEKAEAECLRMLQNFPNSDYVPIARQYLDEVRENLAMRDMMVGDFYFANGKSYPGAASRYQEIIDKYPNFSKRDEAYFKLAQALQKTENTDEAAKDLSRIVSGFPFSKYSAPAKAELQKMGKPVPEVDAQLAAQNQALVKEPTPFSPLSPLINFAKAIGFVGSPDRFEQARKIVAANKAEAEAKARDAATKPAGGKPDEVLINATLQKGPDGKPVVNPNVTPPTTDKKDDKKQDDKTTKKKKQE